MNKLKNKDRLIPPVTFQTNFSVIPVDPRLKEIEQQENIMFSFVLLDLEHEYFNLGGTCENWTNTVFRIMSLLSKEVTPERLRREFSKEGSTLRFHRHIKGTTSHWPDSYSGLIDQGEFCQVRFGKSNGGIHGLLIDNIFYAIWIDPQHNMYPDQKYGGLKKLKPPETCCSKREELLVELQEENNNLMQILDDYTRPDAKEA